MHAFRHWLPPLALFVLTLIWGYSWVVAKQGLGLLSLLGWAASQRNPVIPPLQKTRPLPL